MLSCIDTKTSSGKCAYSMICLLAYLGMRSEFIQAGLPVPIFSVVHGEFKVVMKNGCYKENTTSEKAILDFCSIPRSRAELIEFTDKSRTYTVISLVAPLVRAGKLKMTLPDKPKSSKQRYIKA